MPKKQIFFIAVLALVGGLIGGVVSSQFLMGQPAFAKYKSQQIVEAEGFRLVDKQGKVFANLELIPKHGAFLTLSSINSRSHVKLGFLPGDSPQIILEDHLGERKDSLIRIGSGDGHPSIGLDGLDPTLYLTTPYRSTVGLGFEGVKPTITLWQKRVHRATFRSDILELNDKNGINRAALGSFDLKVSRTGAVEKRPPSSLVLFGEDGKVIWQAP